MWYWVQKFKVRIILIPFILSLFSACDFTFPSFPWEKEPEQMQEEPEVEVTIDSNGGELKTDNFTLTVPKGAFTSAVELKLYEEADTGFGENACSPLYRIEGIPENFNEPLQISIKYSGKLSGNTCFAVGKNKYDNVLDSTILKYELVDASEAGGILNGELNSSSVSFIKSASENIAATWVTALTNGDSVTSEHFELINYSVYFDENDGRELLFYLEELYRKYQKLGFDYTRRNWPIRVVVNWLHGQPFGGFIDGKDNNKYMWWWFEITTQINEHYFYIERTYLDIIQQMYGDGNRMIDLAVSAKMGSEYDYWNELIGPTQFPDYMSAVFERLGFDCSNYSSVFIEMGVGFKARGVPVALVLEYLAKDNDDQMIGRIYENMLAGSNEIKALIAATGNPSEWLKDFHRYMMESAIFNAMLDGFWTENAEEEFGLDPTFTKKSITDNYSDLSGKWYKINLSKDLAEGSSLTIDAYCDAWNYIDISLFTIKNGALSFIGQAENSAEVVNLKDYSSNGEDLIVLISNANYTLPDCNGKNKFTTDFKLQSEGNYNGAKLTLGGVACTFTTTNFDGSKVEEKGAAFTPLFWNDVFDASYAGNKLTVSYDSSYTDLKTRNECYMEITLNEDHTVVTECNAQFIHSGAFFAWEFTETIQISAVNIPLSGSAGNSMYFRVDGPDLANHLTSFKYDYIEYYYDSGNTKTIVSDEDFTFADNCSLRIQLRVNQ